MTKLEFAKEIFKEGNTIVLIDLDNSKLDIYKFIRRCGQNNDLMEVHSLCNRGVQYVGRHVFDPISAAESQVHYFEHYIVKERY